MRWRTPWKLCVQKQDLCKGGDTMTQYPDNIVITVHPDPVQDESTGEYSAVTGSDAVYTLSCRAEMNSYGNKVRGMDGAEYVYSHVVYLPQMDTVIPPDAEYVLTKGAMTFSGRVINASNGQLNSRIWL